MKTQKLGSSELHVTRIAYGCMPLGGTWDKTPVTNESRDKATRALRTALECGITFFDHADIYCHGKSESVFADAISELGVKRNQMVLQSKCGIRFAGDPDNSCPQRFDFSCAHIKNSVEGILRRLKTDRIDVLLLHRPDALVEPEEVAKAFDELHQSGKALYFGMSNHIAAQLDLLRKYVRQPLVANQMELSLVHTPLIDAGIMANQTKYSFGIEGTLEYCRLHNITIQAWAPLAQGRAIGAGKKLAKPDEYDANLARVVGKFADKYGVSKEAIAIAWLLRHPAKIQPVIGSTDAMRIKGMCEADNVELTREEWYALYIAGRGERLP